MKYVLTLIIFLTSFSIVSDPRETMKNLKKMDRDGNRAISFLEYSHKSQKLFQNMDSDSNGVITYEEFSLKKIKLKPTTDSRFDFLDINDDQKVTKEEFVFSKKRKPRTKKNYKYKGLEERKVVAGKIFSKLDTNQDGNVDKKELSVIKEVRSKVAKNHLFEKLNADGNESISKEEYLAPVKAIFSGMDSDSNGAIERKEIKKFMMNKKKKFKKQGKPFIMQKDRKHDR